MAAQSNSVQSLPTFAEDLPEIKAGGESSIGLLLVEDNISDAKLFESILSRAPDAEAYSVVHVKRLSKAVSLLKKTEFQAVILDLHLPDSQGLESVDAIVQMNPNIPVIVLTGMGDAALGIEALRRGAQDYIVKGSLDGEALSECIRYGIERHRIVSQLYSEKDRHKFYADHDHLTELPNRKFFYYHLEHAMAQAKRSGRTMAILFLDLKDFKSINDDYGHQIGDELLKAIALRLRGLLRSADIAARIGGDEFVILLHDIKQDQDAGIIAHRITTSLCEPYFVENYEISPQISIGISIFPKDEQEASALLSAADFAMLQAKQLGQNQYCYFSPSMNVKAQELKELESQILKALEKGEFENHYQPEFDISNDQITSVQALVRWQHPELGLVPARFFVPVLEQNGFIFQLNEWIMQDALSRLQDWHRAGYENLSLSLNVAAASIFRAEEFLAQIQKALLTTKVNPRHLRLEFIEDDILNHRDIAIPLLKKLSEMKIQIVLDGFGTGASSMTQLSKLPIQFVKIDRAVVQKCVQDPQSKGLVTATIALARSLGITTIAEGVETHDQHQVLLSLGCQRIQGHFLGKPSSPKTTELILRARSKGG